MAPDTSDFMNFLVPLPVVLPLAGAAFGVLGSKWHTFQRFVSLVTLVLGLGVSIALFVEVDDKGLVAQVAGGWTAPLGIAFVIDRLSAVMLVVSCIVLLLVMIFAVGQADEERKQSSFHPLYLVLAAGVSASFLTADLFNLFVAFEMMLAASYVLITLGGRAEQIRSGMSYVVISLIASTLFITVLALVYMATGTVNMADLASRFESIDPGVKAAFSIALLVVFGIKAGLFPLYFWLPDSYPTAPGPVTAVFSGLLTKVGVYAIIRTQTLLFDMPDWMGTVLLVVAATTMVFGVLGAIAQDDMKRILAFHIISQIGYMIFGLALFTVAGIAGAIYYVVHNIFAKTALFLVASLVDRRAGSSRLSQVGGLVRSAPVVALLFIVPALSLAGLPPFSGFIGKFSLVDAGLTSHVAWIVAISLAVGLLSMYSMAKIWSGVFWGDAEERPARDPEPGDRLGGPLWMIVPTAAIVACSVALAVWGGPVYEFMMRAAEDLIDPSMYRSIIAGGG